MEHMDMAVGNLTARLVLDADQARDRLHEAVSRAGVSQAALVDGIIDSIRDHHQDGD